MASVSSKEIRTRLRSMHATRQITRAMELVAASKLRRAQNQAQSSRVYSEMLRKTINDVAGREPDISSAYLRPRQIQKTAWILIAGDRGLAGGYNSNILKRAFSQMDGNDIAVLPIGKKAVDDSRNRNYSILTEQYANAEGVSAHDCFFIANRLCQAYLSGELDAIRIAYTNFVSVLSQTPTVLQVLPLPQQKTPTPSGGDILYEPDRLTVLDALIPEYVGGILYGALCQSRASEQAARRTAMDAATSNADEMITKLSLQYNRARQAAITNQIIDIVAGS